MLKFFLLDGHGRSQHEDATARVALNGGLDGGLGADNGKFWICFPQRPDGGAGCCVAGDDERFCALREKPVRRLQAEVNNLLRRFCAVGRVEGVSEIEIVFPRKRPHQLAQNTDSAKSRVKHRNRRAAIRHVSSLLKFHSL